MRTFGTAMLGGFLGSMLFSGLAHWGGFGGLGGFGSSGIGLVEILLFAGLGYFLYRKFLRPAAATGYGTTQYQNTRIALHNTPRFKKRRRSIMISTIGLCR